MEDLADLTDLANRVQSYDDEGQHRSIRLHEMPSSDSEEVASYERLASQLEALKDQVRMRTASGDSIPEEPESPA